VVVVISADHTEGQALQRRCRVDRLEVGVDVEVILMPRVFFFKENH
jgi:hypothetical protein